MCGEYPDAKYVLTIEPTDGVSFPDDVRTIKAYTGCCCNNPEVTITNSEIDDKGNLVITIGNNDIQAASDDDSCNSVLVSIPYKLGTYSCTNPIINGSLSVQNTATDTEVAKLQKFGLYVNVECDNPLVGVSKILIC